MRNTATTCGVVFAMKIFQERPNIDKSARTEVPPPYILADLLFLDMPEYVRYRGKFPVTKRHRKLNLLITPF